ncbi:MAG: DNA-3-methyladenine glycosylase 2 family protein [Clostridia bacterium]|nr:DNA-3-methyladenine glycosylase 2 family protein [Clostridia bacterium]
MTVTVNNEIIKEETVSGCPRVLVRVPDTFSVRQIFDCGQCFRFDPTPGGEGDNDMSGVALGKLVRFRQEKPGELTIEGSDAQDYQRLWKKYLGLDTDYAHLREDIAAHFPAGSVMDEAIEYGRGIRILRQEPFETLISFIISQNNNIPRIKKLVSELCRRAGEEISEGVYAFPTPEAVIALGEEGLRDMKTGFRAGYIYDAATKVVSGEIDLDAVAACGSTAEAADILKRIKGVGPKVAACALLFGFGRLDAFPVDVWIKKSFARHFGGSLDINSLGSYAGLAQQYLFYYERYNN